MMAYSEHVPEGSAGTRVTVERKYLVVVRFRLIQAWLWREMPRVTVCVRVFVGGWGFYVCFCFVCVYVWFTFVCVCVRVLCMILLCVWYVFVFCLCVLCLFLDYVIVWSVYMLFVYLCVSVCLRV